MSTSSFPAEPTPVSPIAGGRAWAVTGMLLCVISLFGIRRVAQGVLGALSAVGVEAANDVEARNAYFKGVAADLGIWLIPGLVGMILAAVALLRFRNREQWFFWCGLIASLFLLPFLPPFALALLVLLLVKTKQFFKAPGMSA